MSDPRNLDLAYEAIAEWTLLRGGPAPLHQQLRSHIALQIRSGRLAAGARLPPVRALAAGLGLNRNTVQKVYAALERAGLVVTRVGSGTQVAPGQAETMAQVASSTRELLRRAIGNALDDRLAPQDVRLLFESQLSEAVRQRDLRATQIPTSRRRYAARDAVKA